MSIGTVVGGVDTHKDIHVAAALDVVGRVLGTATFSNTAVGHVELWRWLASFGSVLWVGIEGTGSYGSSLARRLRSDGVAVVEVSRPNRKRRRRLGKDDTVDAVNAALAVLSGDATVEPKSGDGAVESLRFVQVARRSAVKARSQPINQLQAVIDTAPDLVRAELAGMGVPEVVRSAALVTRPLRL